MYVGQTTQQEPLHENNAPPRFRPPQPPPQFAPDFCRNEETFSPGFLRNHLHHCVYFWLTSGHEFWMFPTALEDNTMEGYIWEDGRWTRYMFDSRMIKGLF